MGVPTPPLISTLTRLKLFAERFPSYIWFGSYREASPNRASYARLQLPKRLLVFLGSPSVPCEDWSALTKSVTNFTPFFLEGTRLHFQLHGLSTASPHGMALVEAEVYEEQLRTLQLEMEAIDEEARVVWPERTNDKGTSLVNESRGPEGIPQKRQTHISREFVIEHLNTHPSIPQIFNGFWTLCDQCLTCLDVQRLQIQWFKEAGSHLAINHCWGLKTGADGL